MLNKNERGHITPGLKAGFAKRGNNRKYGSRQRKTNEVGTAFTKLNITTVQVMETSTPYRAASLILGREGIFLRPVVAQWHKMSL